MNVQVTSTGKSMAEKFFDDDIIHSGFEQPRCKGMPPVMVGSLAIVLLAVLFSGLRSQAIAASVADVEIGHLLGYLERSGCAVYRNGKWYGASDARAHLEKKYRYLLDKGMIDTTEDFIDRVATASSISGKPYQVKCDGREQVSSVEWLTMELERLRRPSAPTTSR